MIKWIDARLNGITMYRLILLVLVGLLGVALIFSLTGVFSYDPYALVFTTAFLVVASGFANWFFARILGLPSNLESAYITGLILALIITPIQSLSDLPFLAWAAVLAMASKYLLNVKGKHLFNPAAFAVALTYFTLNQDASWWVGNGPMLPFVLVGGLLIVRKLRRFDLLLSFLGASLAAILLAALLRSQPVGAALQNAFLYSPLFFFAFIFLTEPATTPPTRRLRMMYGALVGVLFAPLVHIGSFYTTPELALLFGNLFSFLVSPKATLMLKLKRKTMIAPDVYELTFQSPRKLAYAPGQYMEWTLGMDGPDSRGNRRYFTLASSPTEHDLRLGVKVYPHASSFKRALLAMDRNDEIQVSRLAGDFVLPADPAQKIVFIAGGIGVTPFRSMVQYLLDTRQPRPIVLFYGNRSARDVAYKPVFDRAERELGIPTYYMLDDTSQPPADWDGRVITITPQAIRKYVPDYQASLFYISGPVAMIDVYKKMLREMGIPGRQIKTDYFPGL